MVDQSEPTPHKTAYKPTSYKPSEPVLHPDRDQSTLRRQMVSVGKQPKAGIQRKKKDMVEELYDSLTDYFDPTQGRRTRRKAKTFEEELQEKRDIELVHQLESEGGQPEEDVEEAPGPSLLVEEFDGKFFDKKKSKKRKHEEIERPPTPTEVIEQREIEWKERQKQRHDKQRKRHRGEDSGDENWSHDVMAEQASQECFESTIDEIVMDVDIDLLKQSMGNDEDEDGGEGDGQFLVDTYKMEMIRVEAQKLKEWRKLNKVNIDRLVKLITVLERNIRDVIPREGEAPLVTFLEEEIMDEDDPTTRELVDDRLLRAASAACTALLVMTGAKMPKQVFIEDAIDRSIQLCKQYLNHIVFPSSDIVYRSPNKQKKTEEKSRGRRKHGGNNRTPTAQRIYLRMNDLIGCFAELIRVQSLSDMAVHQLCTIAASTFFVNNIGEMQWQAMRLLSNIFNRYNDHMRHNILQDIVNSLHRLPSAKTSSNSLRISNETWLNNMTVLIMQLVQATVQMPKRKKKDSDENGTSEKEELEEADHLVKSSFESAFRIAALFLQGFLQKCCSKGEEDNRPVFEAFLQDLLNALHKPEWPAAEFLLSILGNLLVKHYRATKGTEIALRTASLEYLGLITAKLKKDVRSAEEDAQRRLEIVVKTLVYEELDDPPENIADVDIEDMSMTDKLKKLEQSLIDYLLLSRNDASTEYAVSFYACYWYKETAEDLDKLRLTYKAQKKKADESNEKELRKMEKKMEKLNEKGRAMKDYLIKIVDKRQMRKRIEHIKRNNQNVMMESDAAWAVKYLASRRELTQTGFENYLKQILYGVISEPTVSLRTKAMKCLTQIIEADHSVLGVPEVQNAVQARMVDPNAQVREATIELLGKYLVSRPDFIPKYYPILLERIKDSGTAVRKRVIRIMRELIEKNPSFDKTPEMLSRIVRRIGDEEGVKKLVIETFNSLWFQPLREHDQEALIKRVMIITEATEICVAEGTVEQLELLLTNVFKTSDKATIFACRQIVDCLVDNVLALETKMAADNSLSEMNKMNGQDETFANARRAKSNQDRMLACLTALSLFSKVRAELLVKHAETLQPYLSMTVNTAAETQVLKQVIDMLRRVIPLMSHPSDSFIDGLEDSFSQLLLAGKVTIIESAVECGGALFEKFPRRRPKMTDIFLKFLANLNNMKKMLERDLKSPVPEERIAFISRGIFCLGLLARYFDLDFVLEEEPDTIQKYVIKHELPPNPLMENHAAEDDEKPRVIRDNVFVLLCFFLGVPQATIQRNALISLGHLSAQYAEYLMRPEVRSMYNRFLGRQEPEFLAVKVLTLQNLERFLINEENRMQKHNEEWQKRKETEDLKEMDQAGSGLGSAVIQLYWNHVLNCYFNREKEVRNAAVQVTWRTLSQGLVTPGSSIPTLIAMMTDPLQTIRHKVENLLKEIDTKYQGMVQTKAVSGIRIAFQLHSKVNGDDRRLLRGIRLVEGSATANTAHKKTSTDEWGIPRYTNDGQALLSGLYQALRGNRQQRRSFLQSILRLFSEDSKEKLTLPELIFVGDNIAMFPYQVMDEPLYVIHEIDKIVPFSGESIIGHFKASLLPKSGPPGQPGKDDVDFEPEAIYRRLPNDKTHLFELMNNSQACFILLYLKTFLMKLYGFTEAKVQEYSPTDGAKLYEKAIGRKNVHMFCPQSAIAELDPTRVADRDTMKGHFNLSHQICDFHKMLLSLDRGEDDDDVPQEEQQAEQDCGADGRDDESDVDESDAPSETASHP